MFALSLPLGEQIGLGTVLNVLAHRLDDRPGAAASSTRPSPTALQWVFLLGGTVLFGVGSGFYIGAGLGPGPRDGVMTGIAKRGYASASCAPASR